jgi:tRNA G46 methylase TrmB
MREFKKSLIAPPIGSTHFSDLKSNLFSNFQFTDIDLEIGAGVGWHSIQYARANPTRFLISIEHTRSKFTRFQARHAHHPELKNLLPIHADAIRWVTHCLEPASLSRCFILYPNPEPKAPNKRWLRMPFMRALLETLRADGKLTLATNEFSYFSEALEYGNIHWGLDFELIRAFDSGKPRTHFEKKYLERGQPCFEFTATKRKI